MYDELKKAYEVTNDRIEAKSGLTELQKDNRIQLVANLFNYIEMVSDPRAVYERYLEANYDPEDDTTYVTFDQFYVEQMSRLKDSIHSDIGPL